MQHTLNKIKALKKQMVCRKLDESMVLVPLVNDVAEMRVIYTLNEVASFIWENIDNANSFEELTHEVVNNFEIDHETAKNDITDFFYSLLENNS